MPHLKIAMSQSEQHKTGSQHDSDDDGVFSSDAEKPKTHKGQCDHEATNRKDEGRKDDGKQDRVQIAHT